LIVFNFQAEGQPLQAYIEQVFRAADFLQYGATEQQLVDRVVMNFHPSILGLAAFLDRPCSRVDLLRVVGLIEDKFSVERERERVARSCKSASSQDASGVVRGRTVPGAGEVTRCWDCGHSEHLRRNCPRKTTQQGNGQGPGGRMTPGQRS
jgi:hypothetical protein